MGSGYEHCFVVASGLEKLADIYCSIYSTKLPLVLPHSGKALLGWEREGEPSVRQHASAFKEEPTYDIRGSSTFVGIRHWGEFHSLGLIGWVFFPSAGTGGSRLLTF